MLAEVGTSRARRHGNWPGGTGRTIRCVRGRPGCTALRAPSPGARVAAFVAILLGGLAGGLIGYTLVKLQCHGTCATQRGLGALFGAIVAALGMSVVAVLGAACPRRVERSRAPPEQRRRIVTDLSRRAAATWRRGSPSRRASSCSKEAKNGVTSASTKSSDTDVVTEFDRASEQLIVDGLSSERPDDAVIGEEGTDAAGASGRSLADRSDRRDHQLLVRPAGLRRLDRRAGRRSSRWPAPSTCPAPASCSQPSPGGVRC